MLSEFDALNSNLSAMHRTQGKIIQNFHTYTFSGTSYLCWAFSCASMLRTSCTILIKKLFKAGKINEERKEKCLAWIQSDENHQKIRNLIAMILLPKKLHKSGDSQAAYLRAAVSRVSLQKQDFNLYFRLHTQLYWKSQAL